MIDIHNHLLPDIDDGPRDLRGSIAMAEAAIRSGITHVVCTPHASYRYKFEPRLNAERLASVQQAVGDKLVLHLGCDFHLSVDNVEALFIDPSKYTINGTQYILIELPDVFVFPQISDVLFEMKVKGLIPIITHPERNAFLSAHLERALPWLRTGCLMQVTAGAVIGTFGKGPEATAEKLLENGMVHIIASDAHNPESRPFLLREAHGKIAKVHGSAIADRLCIHNPRAVIDGDTISLSLDAENAPGHRWHKGLISRLFLR